MSEDFYTFIATNLIVAELQRSYYPSYDLKYDVKYLLDVAGGVTKQEKAKIVVEEIYSKSS